MLTANTRLGKLGGLPAVCAVVAAIHGVNLLLMVVGNVTDFETNREYVRHVMSMDTTNFGLPAGEALNERIMWRAVTNPVAQDAAYVAIIVWEAIAALVLLASALALFRAPRGYTLDGARRLASLGFVLSLALFFGAFIAIGGEWFQMWRSHRWNGVEPAFRYGTMAAIGLLLVHMPSRDWSRSGELS